MLAMAIDLSTNTHGEPLDPRLWRPYRVDVEPNLFSEMQALQEPQFEDALNIGYDTVSLFVPGCTLSIVSAPLVGVVYDWLTERGLVDGIMLKCCGKVLKSSALPQEHEAYNGMLAATLVAQGVRRIITACPNCYLAYKKLVPNTEVLALSEVLLDEGLRLPSGFANVPTCVHDSCPDRMHGTFAKSVRAILAGTLLEMEHTGAYSQCCGLGKMLAIANPELSIKLNKARRQEFAATGATRLVTYCANCTLAFQPTPDDPIHAWHYLELLFDVHIDWQLYAENLAIALETLSER
jgi:Fe-S oxidoreductase